MTDAPTPDPDEKREIDAIFSRLAPDGNLLSVYNVIEGQLGVLHTRSMSLIQLAGVVITVTGFSGRIIADTNLTAQMSIITGLVLVLVAAAVCLGFVMPVRWVSSYLHLPPEQWVLTALRRRKRKNRAFALASAILVLGLTFYILAISIMLLNPGAAELKMVR